MAKSRKETGTIERIGSACNGTMPWESPYARVRCLDGIIREWWFDEGLLDKLAPGMMVSGFVREKTGRLFRVKITN